MNRLLKALQTVLHNETMIAWVDSFLACMGLTGTIASSAPALERLRRRREGRS